MDEPYKTDEHGSCISQKLMPGYVIREYADGFIEHAPYDDDGGVECSPAALSGTKH